MPARDEKRRDPLAGLGKGEPVEELGLTLRPSALDRKPRSRGRQRPIRPTEKRRRSRKLTITFSDEKIPQRLRALAKRWEMAGPDGQKPNVSALIEYLLLPHLEAAEAGEIEPPEG